MIATPAHPDETASRQRMLAAARRLVDLKLNRGTSGNLSVRCEGGFLITPSGVPVENLSAESMVGMDQAGNAVTAGKPSSEWRIHRDILAARPEIGAVVHTHSMFATTLACLQRDIPSFHYMVAVAGGDSIRCAPYALFGSQELSDLAVTALKNRNACLLAHHGMIALGHNLDEAVALADEVEALSEQFWRILQTGNPKLLSGEQMNAVMEQFKGYGQWKR